MITDRDYRLLQLATRYFSPVAGLGEAGVVRDHRSRLQAFATRHSPLTTRHSLLLPFDDGNGLFNEGVVHAVDFFGTADGCR